jgi:large subunit ribosomal protein L37Ae
MVKIYSKRSKRFGPRYGRTLRKRVDMIESVLHQKHACPFCLKKGGISRVSVGVWKCTKCENTFTGKAYDIN